MWDFVLREGVLFHDGTEMTAADVVSSMEFHKLGGVGLIGGQVDRVEATGRYGVRFFLNAPNCRSSCTRSPNTGR